MALIRNIAGLNRRLGVADAMPINTGPFSFGTDAGQIATPVNVQKPQTPSAGYADAVQILSGAVAGGQPLSVGDQPPEGLVTNQASILPDSGSSIGNLLLAAGAVAGTIYLLSSGNKTKSVSGNKKTKYTVPLLIGGGLLALYLMNQNTSVPAVTVPAVVAPVSPAAAITTAAQTAYQKTAQLIQQL
jgi:hypothetical protein